MSNMLRHSYRCISRPSIAYSSSRSLVQLGNQPRQFSRMSTQLMPFANANKLRPAPFLLQQNDTSGVLHRHNFPSQQPDTTHNAYFSTASTQVKLKPKRKRYRSKKLKSNPETPTPPIPTVGPTGRRIMSESLLANHPHLSTLPYDMKNNPKATLNGTTKHKLCYTQSLQFDTVGPPGDQLFLATTTTSFDLDQNSTTELICSGIGRTKKLAEYHAAMDLILALKEIGIDARNPPDLEKMNEHHFHSAVARAQMLLELLDSSRPKFTLENSGRGCKASVSAWVKGEYFIAEGQRGRNKAKAEGLALIELVSEGGELMSYLNEYDETRGTVERYLEIIEASPRKHIAALCIPPLPYEVVLEMEDVIGGGRHEARMEEHERIKAEYEEKFSGGRVSHSRRRQPKDFDRINEGLRVEEEQKTKQVLDNPEGKLAKMKALRDALPITAIRQDLLDALKTDQVVVVSGGTGSGKSTQCPQYILEDALLSSKGAHTEIIVTQPRKIAAVSVAQRVADERHEKVGNSVGYTVRFHRQSPREVGGTIEFVTTGVLLNRIMNDEVLEGVSHVIIDEVHERDINTDFLLILLRDLLQKRPDLRVILMSATLNADSFADYFNNVNTNRKCQHLSVPTQPRHPVDVFYLEDMASMTQDVQGLAKSLLQYHDEKLRIELEEAELEANAAAQLETRAHDEDEGLLLDSDSDSEDDLDSESDDLTPLPGSRVETLRRAVSLRGNEWTTTGTKAGSDVWSRPDEREAGDAIVQLIAKLALSLSTEEISSGRKGSILCFLPGWDEIKAATAVIEEEINMNMRTKIKILPLHSTIPHDDQQKVFIPAEEGTVKVILATNIAESSVTIDDVLAVIDGGLVRELCWDAESAMSTMETVPTSRASATQRLGRAGRVAPGKCYRLYSRAAFEAMPERPTPEIQRTALEQTCLQTCSMAQDGIEQFLSRSMDPPQSESVEFSVNRLVQLGALRIDDKSDGGGELLTPLGRVLSRLPLDPATGKMLVMGTVMRCLDPIVTAAACFSSRSIFYNPPGMRDEAQKIRKSFSDSSDTLAQLLAYKVFYQIVKEESWDSACSWAKANYVSIAAMISIKAVRSQLLTELKKIGLITNSDLEKVGYKEWALKTDSSVNCNAYNELLCNAVVASSIPGNISSRRQLGNFGTLRTRTENHTEIHPSSVIFHRKPPKGVKLPSWYIYREMVLSSQVFLRDCSAMRPEQIILFGGYELKSLANQTIHLLDDWIVAESTCDETINLMLSARKEINAALEYKVMHPRHPLPFESQDVIDSICQMFDIMDSGDAENEFMHKNESESDEADKLLRNLVDSMNY